MNTESTPRHFRQQLTIVACYATMFMLGVTISLLGPSLPGFAAHVGVTLTEAGLFFTLFSGGSLLATLLVARVNDHPVRHAMLVFSALVVALGEWLIAGSNTFVLAGAAIGLTGVAMSAVSTAPNAIIIDLFRDRTGQALNALHLVAGIGAFLGPLLVGAAIHAGSDYRIAYRMAAIAMLGVSLLWALSRPPRPQRTGAGNAPWLEGAVFPLLLIFALALLYTGTEQTLGGWLFTYAGTTGAAGSASLATSLFWLAILMGRLTAVRMLRRFSNVGLLRLCVALGMGGVGLTLLGQVFPAALWGGIALTGFGFGPVFPTALALVSELMPARAGAAGSLMIAAGSMGAMVLPWAAGALMPYIGVAGSIGATLAPLTLMLACVAIIAQRIRSLPLARGHQDQ